MAATLLFVWWAVEHAAPINSASRTRAANRRALGAFRSSGYPVIDETAMTPTDRSILYGFAPWYRDILLYHAVRIPLALLGKVALKTARKQVKIGIIHRPGV